MQGVNTMIAYSLLCEFCCRGGQLYRIVHPDPVCEDYIVCHKCREKVLDEA